MTHPSLCVQPRGDFGECWGARQSLALSHFPVSLQVWEKGFADKTKPQNWVMAPRAVGIPCVPMEMKCRSGINTHRADNQPQICVSCPLKQSLRTAGWDLNI